MKAIILAAGRGSRMGKATVNIPKCMMMLLGKTLLEHCMDSLHKAGFSPKDIGIVTGYKREMFFTQDVHYFHNAKWESTNMFVSLTMAAEWLRAEPCIVCYSDIFFSSNAVNKLMESKHEFSITYYNGFRELWNKRFYDPLSDLETFRQEDGKLLEIGQRPNSIDDVQGQYMGLLKFEPTGWAKIEQAVKLPMPKPVEILDMTTLLQHLITLGYNIEAIETSDIWLECDNQSDIVVNEEILRNQ